MSTATAEINEALIPAISTWTPNQRERVLQDLFDRTVVGPLPLGEVAPGTGFLAIKSNELIQPNRCATITAPAMSRFKPQRLVIFEGYEDRIHTRRIPIFEACSVRQPWWKFWSPSIRKSVEVGRQVDHSTEILITPRDVWDIQGLYIGQHIQWGSQNTIPGASFGLDGNLEFDGAVCEPGVAITIQVQHDSPRPHPFRGVILGRYLPALRTSVQPKRIYIAGPIGVDDEGRPARVQAAYEVADRLRRAGLSPFVPHAYDDYGRRHEHSYECWMEFDAVWLRQCEALIRIPGISPGADREVDMARRLGMPVFDCEANAIRWARDFAPGDA